ncbi:MAG: cell wall-binding repeat-containing protein [Eubacteriaceae bacterium]
MKRVFVFIIVFGLFLSSFTSAQAISEENIYDEKIHYSEFIEKLEKEKDDNDYIRQNTNLNATIQNIVTSNINDPDYNEQWNFNKINMEAAWNKASGTNQVKVAIIDSGLDIYSDINGANVVDGCSIINGVKTVGQFSDSTYQGTRIASIIAAQKNSIGIAGIAPNAKIIPIKVSQSNGKNSISDTIIGVQWAMEKGANIIYINTCGDIDDSNLESIIDEAYESNIIILSPTGDGSSNDDIDYPGAYSNVISVGSTNSNDNVSSFSNKGMEIDITAPGENIYLPSSASNYTTYNGTSYAAATVAGVAVLLKTKYSSLSNTKLEQILCTSALDITDIKGWDWDSGHGRIDASKSFDLAESIVWDNNDLLTSANSIVFNQNITGKLYPSDDIDTYKITLSKPSKIIIESSCPTSTDIMIILTDKDGYLYDYVDANYAGEAEWLETEIYEAGTYYVQILDFYGDYSINENYILNIIKPVSKGESQRLSGKNRWDTTSLISREGWYSSKNVVLAYGMNFPDALSAAPFALALNAPILLTDKDKIPTETLNEINRLQPENIYLLGGELVIKDSVANQLSSKGYTVSRIWGQNRFQTAIQIGNELRNIVQTDTAVLTYGMNYPDALGISGIAAEKAWPILFTDKNTLQTDTKNALIDWGIKKVKIIGGTLVISAAIENELKSMGISVERIAGQNRIDTCIKIAQRFKSATDGIIVTTGFNFPDAISGGPLSGKLGYPIILVEKDSAATIITNYVSNSQADRGIFLGGTLAISNNAKNQITNNLDQ